MNLYLSGIVASLLFAFSIIPSIGASKVSKQEREEIVSALDRMYSGYLNGSLSQARSNLLNAIQFIDKNRALVPELESSLPIAFARLSLLERTAGNDAQSQIYFEKSRYWRIVEREKGGVKPDEIIADHLAFTRDESDKYVLEWDEKRAKGQGPAYLRKTADKPKPILR